ncbi:unnamed protein product [Anisakis simplex]|uniref:Putative chaperone binding protein (inferred by orthology to a S. mansoni protein) n=1 Tax=Anisakis simplex TaxID=6269 RepID=A0A0M3KEC4_ANISI|nr:unnamed protein product [Anisakis simplex]
MYLNCRWDFYQTESHIILNILKRGVSLDECKVKYANQFIDVLVNDASIFHLELLHPIDSSNLQVKCTPSKTTIVNWDKFAKEVDEEEDKVEGDDAVNRMFQKIYAEADDDVKKAMLKSYTESGGTVLSTNWNEIKKKRTEIKPPEGMEFKRWND